MQHRYTRSTTGSTSDLKEGDFTFTDFINATTVMKNMSETQTLLHQTAPVAGHNDMISAMHINTVFCQCPSEIGYIQSQQAAGTGL